MEKISAACAQEWSIRLEKGLRSKNPSRKIEAAVQIGTKLQHWSKEPPITMAMANMYGLVPGEDRLFANSILLRLADAFKNGDHNMRVSILRVFLLELRQRQKMLKPYNGILSKDRVPNYLELLRRVKYVFNTDDVKSRALSLRVIGCWADLAKDSADVRYMIISCLDSCHTLEVKASLFAAGCFCELSQDFALFVLEVLVRMLTSPDTSTIIKLAAARAFSTMRASCCITWRAYEAGIKLVLNSLEEDVKIGILYSLSKLASKSVLLFSKQVELLLSILDNGSVSNLTVKSVKFLLGLVEEGISCISNHVKSVRVLLRVINNSDFPLDCQCDALKVLKKIFHGGSQSLNWIDMPESIELVKVVVVIAECQSTKKKLLALGLLVDISCNIVKAHCHISSQDGEISVPLASKGNHLAQLPKHAAMLLINCLALLMNQVKEREDILVSIFSLKQELQCLLNLGLHLLKKFPRFGSMVLEQVQCLIEELLNFSDGLRKEAVVDVDPDNPFSSFCGSKRLEDVGKITISKEAVLCMFRIVAAWLETLDESGEITIGICQNLNCFVERIKEYGVLEQDKCVIFSLIQKSRLICHFLKCQGNTICDMEKNVNDWIISSRDCWFEHEQLVLAFAKQMVIRTDFGGAYRTGKYAACHAAWFSATFAFGLLSRKIHASRTYWLKSLALFAGAESEILLLIFPKLGYQVVNYLQENEEAIHTCNGLVEEDGEVDLASNGGVDLCDYREKLSRAYNRVCSADEILGGASTLEGTFYFQRWFLSLRAEFFGALVDLLGHSRLENYDGLGLRDGVGEPGSQALGEHLAAISFRFNRLAKELDLLATSFMDMDYKSFRSIARLAVCCSVLAFSSACVFSPNQSSQDKNNSCTFLVHDLVLRLWHIDRSICMHLYNIFKCNGELRGLKTICRTQMSSCSYRERAIATVSRFSISYILQLLEKLRPVKGTEQSTKISQARLHLLFSIVRMMMCIPFQTPKYFFRMRPQVGAELFIFNADTRSSGRLSVLRGLQLSVNLCIQLKLPDCNLRVSKIFCILAAKPSDTLADGSGERKKLENSTSKHWKTDVDLNDVLLLYVNEELGTEYQRGGDSGSKAKSFMSLKPTERNQGFSTCLLDVSSLPEGCYEIEWCSCCIDCKGSYWNLLPLNAGPVFTIYNSPSVCTF